MTEINLHFSNVQSVERYARQGNKILLILDDSILDVTSFAIHHPGGAALLHSKKGIKIDEQMKFHHPRTLYLATSMAIGSFGQDLARIIDPSKPILSQIWHLNHEDYMNVVNSPHWLFVPSPQFFSNSILDKFSHTRWYGALLVPILLISLMFYQIPSWENYDTSTILAYAFSGFFIFTLTEYIVHRFLFHSQNYLPPNRASHILHFFLHGLHHMLPTDPDRLVLPPMLSLFYVAVGYFTVLRVVKIENPIYFAFFWTFFLIGYCCYDLIHYALHHVDTSKSKGGYFHRLQQYHNQHHYGGEERGFGVSSKFWDIIFRSGFLLSKKEV